MSFELIEVGKRPREDDETQSISCVVAETTEEEQRGLCAEGDPPLGMPTDKESGTVSMTCVAKIKGIKIKDLPKSCWAPMVVKNVLEENIKDGKYEHDDRKALATQPFVKAHNNTKMTFKTEENGNREDVDELVEKLMKIYDQAEPVAQESEEDRIVLDRDKWKEEIEVNISPSVSWTKQPFKHLLKLYYYSRDQGDVYENLEQRFGNDDADPLTQGHNTELGESYVPSPHDVGSYLLGYVAVDRGKSLHAMHVARTNRKGRLEAKLKSLFANAAMDRLTYEDTKDLVENLGHRALDSTVFPNVYHFLPFSLPEEGVNDDNVNGLIERWKTEKQRNNIPPNDHSDHIFNWETSAVQNKENNKKIIKETQDIIDDEYHVLKVPDDDGWINGGPIDDYFDAIVKPHVVRMIKKIAEGRVEYDDVSDHIEEMFILWGEDRNILWILLYNVVGENWKDELNDPQKFKQMQVVKNILLGLGFTIKEGKTDFEEEIGEKDGSFNEYFGDFPHAVVSNRDTDDYP